MNTFLDASDIEHIQKEVAAFRKPGAHEPGKWSVSHHNRNPKVLGGAFPARVCIRDITLRTIEQVPGVAIDLDDRLHLGRALAEARVPAAQISFRHWGVPLKDIQRQVDAMKSIYPEMELSLDGAITPADVDYAAEAGVDMVQFVNASMPGVARAHLYELAWQGRDWRSIRLPRTVEEQISTRRRLVDRARERGVKISAGMNFIAYATEEYVEAFSRAMAKEGADHICLYDTSAGLAPEGWRYLCNLVKRVAPGVTAAVHVHNSFGLGVANGIAALQGGAEVVEVSVNGVCAGFGQADLAELTASLDVLYGVPTGIRLDRLTPLRRLVEDLTGEPVSARKPITGPEAWTLGVDGQVLEQDVDPLLPLPMNPAVVGNKGFWRLTRSSGPWLVQRKLQELGISANKQQVERVLGEVKQEMLVRRRGLEDFEVAEIAQSVVQRGP